MPHSMKSSLRPSNRSLLTVAILLLVAIIGGPVIFYGALALGDAGVFANASENFWPIVGSAIALIAIYWFAILYIGSRALRQGSAD